MRSADMEPYSGTALYMNTNVYGLDTFWPTRLMQAFIDPGLLYSARTDTIGES